MVKILVIEDDLRVSQLISRGLSDEGYEIDQAYDGELGLRLALQNEYMLIITDIVLPKLSGVDLCRMLRSTKPTLPILMLTALGTVDDKIDGFDAGADDYLVKPFDFRELNVRIRVLLKRNNILPQSQGSITRYSDLEIDNQTKTARRSGKEIKLNPQRAKALGIHGQ